MRISSNRFRKKRKSYFSFKVDRFFMKVSTAVNKRILHVCSHLQRLIVIFKIPYLIEAAEFLTRLKLSHLALNCSLWVLSMEHAL